MPSLILAILRRSCGGGGVGGVGGGGGGGGDVGGGSGHQTVLPKVQQCQGQVGELAG